MVAVQWSCPASRKLITKHGQIHVAPQHSLSTKVIRSLLIILWNLLNFSCCMRRVPQERNLIHGMEARAVNRPGTRHPPPLLGHARDSLPFKRTEGAEILPGVEEILSLGTE